MSTDKNAVVSLKTEEELRDLVRDMQYSLDKETTSEAGFGFDAATKAWKERIEAFLPAPPAPRTLADMSPDERAECEWMQCDHPQLEEPGVILHIWGNGCHVVSREGVVETEALNHVTPRPDLPRLEWPDKEHEREGVPCRLDKDGDHWVKVDKQWHMVDPDFAYDELPELYGPYRPFLQEEH